MNACTRAPLITPPRARHSSMIVRGARLDTDDALGQVGGVEELRGEVAGDVRAHLDAGARRLVVAAQAHQDERFPVPSCPDPPGVVDRRLTVAAAARRRPTRSPAGSAAHEVHSASAALSRSVTGTTASGGSSSSTAMPAARRARSLRAL